MARSKFVYTRKLVMIESPYKNSNKEDLDKFVKYARRCMLDSLFRGEAPFAGHLLYTQILADTRPDERSIGISCDMSWLKVSDLVAVYTDYGVSKGMSIAIRRAKKLGIQVVRRKIGWND